MHHPEPYHFLNLPCLLINQPLHQTQYEYVFSQQSAPQQKAEPQKAAPIWCNTPGSRPQKCNRSQVLCAGSKFKALPFAILRAIFSVEGGPDA
jgi:hypothetical protein